LPGSSGAVGDVEVGSVNDCAAAVVRLEGGVEEAAGEESAFGGPGGFAGVNHLFGPFEQVSEVHEGATVLEPEAGGLVRAVGVFPGDGEIFDARIRHEDAGPQAVEVVDDEER